MPIWNNADSVYVGEIPADSVYVGDNLVWSATSPLDLAPAIDQPTIVTSAVGASAASTIAGSPGWLREKRTGVAETAAGGAQSSTNALDISGSTRFYYPGILSASGSASNPGAYVSSDFKPGSTAALQNARWLMAIDIVTNSPVVEYRMNAVATGGRFGLIFVNGKRISETATLHTSPPNAGSGLAVKLTFPDSRSRRVTVYGLNHNEGRWGGVAIGAGYTISKPAPGGRKVAIIGDSYVNGSGTVPTGATGVETFAWPLALLLGGDEIIQAGIGSTGYVATLSGEPTSNFAGRVAPILSLDPDVVIIAGGRNDVATGLQAAVTSLLTSLSTIPELYVMPTASESTQADVRSAISAACTSAGRPYLNVAIDALPKGGDGIHPTFDGHKALAADAFSLT